MGQWPLMLKSSKCEPWKQFQNTALKISTVIITQSENFYYMIEKINTNL